MPHDECVVVTAALLYRTSGLARILCLLGAIAEKVTSVIKVGCMARLARVVAVGVPHHVTQRGNGRQFILACDPDRSVYLDLLRQSIVLHGVELIGYCLMSNHVHLVAVPNRRFQQKICGQDLWSDGTGTLLEVVNRPPLFCSFSATHRRHNMNPFSSLQNLRYAETIPDIVSWHGTIHSCGCR
jgi:hypothetical protein